MNGFTMKGGRVIIWTTKEFVSDDFPFNDTGKNYTYFYKKVGDKDPFTKLLAATEYRDKKEHVGNLLGINPKKIFIKSKKAHFREKHKK